MIKAKPTAEIYQIYSDLPNSAGCVEIEKFLNELKIKHQLTENLLSFVKDTWRKQNKVKMYYADLWGNPGRAAREELGK